MTPDAPRSLRLPTAALLPLGALAALAGCASQQTVSSSSSPASAAAKPAPAPDAVASARAAIAKEPDNWRGYNRLGLAYYEKRQYDRAIAAFEQALQLHPITVTLEEEKKQRDAIEAQKRAQQAEIARQQRAAEAAAEEQMFASLFGAMAAGSNMNADQMAMLNTTNTLLQASNRIGATGPVAMPDGPAPTSQLKSRREAADIHSNLGMACFGARRWPKALAAFETALAQDPARTELLRRIAETHLQEGSHEKAALVLHRYLAIAATPPLASRVTYAGLLASLGLKDEAARAHATLLTEYAERLETAAAGPELSMEAADVMIRAGKPKDAADTLRRAVPLSESLAPSQRLSLGARLFSVGECAAAAELLEELTSGDTPSGDFDRPYALCLLGRCRAELGQTAAAEAAFRRALAGVPAGAAVPESLLVARIETGDAAAVARELLEAQLDDTDSRARHLRLSWLALAYEKSGDIPRAIAAANLAIRQQPDFGPALRQRARLEKLAAPIRRDALAEADEAAEAGDLAAATRRLAAAARHATDPAERTALRRRLLETVARLPQPPPPTETAKRLLLQGNAAFKASKEAADLERAVTAYEWALVECPEIPAPYLNLSLAQTVLHRYGEAEENLRLHLAGAPSGKDADALLARLYELEYSRKRVLRDTLQSK